MCFCTFTMVAMSRELMNTTHRHIHRALGAQAFWSFAAASASSGLHRGTEPDTLPMAGQCPVKPQPWVLECPLLIFYIHNWRGLWSSPSRCLDMLSAPAALLFDLAFSKPHFSCPDGKCFLLAQLGPFIPLRLNLHVSPCPQAINDCILQTSPAWIDLTPDT